LIWIVAVLVALLGLVALLNAVFPGALGQDDRQIRLTHNVLLLALLGGSLALGYRGGWRAGVKHALVWIGIAAALTLGYSYRDDLMSVANRMSGQLSPTTPMTTDDGAVELRAANNGHFQADVWVDGVKMRMLVDTGASTIALAPDDAERLGIDLDALRYDRVVNTANGQAYVAVVRLDEVEIGPIRLFDLQATVHRDGLDDSLLGMNALDRLSGFERRGDRLILWP
jgi:aspartyl protease family protein